MEALGRGVLCMLIVVATRTVDTEAMYTTGSVSIIDGHAVLKRDRLDKSSTAYGTYNDTMYTTGWGVFNVKAGYSKSDMKDTDVMYAAGYLEGALTAERIYQHYVNIHSLFLGKGKEDLERKVRIFFNKQEDWVRQQISDNLSSEYWKAVSVIIAQLDGLVDGYTAYPYENKTLDRFAFQLLNGVGDMIDLRDALSPSTRPDWTKMSPSHFQMYFANHGHCSALFKVLGAYENIFMAHSSWFDYSSTIRIYKHYNFNLKSISVASKQMSFSSYPGFLESLDDYYLLGNGLVMIQTSINVYNDTLYDFVKPQSLLAWIRVRVANMMANNGKEWASMLSQYNS
ncbi:phospholipase B-like 1, partial [Saccoglossus kowalevskii]